MSQSLHDLTTTKPLELNALPGSCVRRETYLWSRKGSIIDRLAAQHFDQKTRAQSRFQHMAM